MSDLERVLRELEVATAASAEITLNDVEATRLILKQRGRAIAAVAALTPALAALPAAERAEAASRLESAVKGGESARQRLLDSKRAATMEWGRWNQVHLALTPSVRPGAGKLDYRG